MKKTYLTPEIKLYVIDKPMMSANSIGFGDETLDDATKVSAKRSYLDDDDDITTGW